MAEQCSEVYTPVQDISMEHLKRIIRNNVLNSSIEYRPDNVNVNDVDSPLGQPSRDVISRRLFQSPLSDDRKPNPEARVFTKKNAKKIISRKRLLLASSEKIKPCFVRERDIQDCSSGGARKKVLLSLLNNKKYIVDLDTSKGYID